MLRSPWFHTEQINQAGVDVWYYFLKNCLFIAFLVSVVDS